MFAYGHWVTRPELVTDSVTVTATRAPEAPMTPSPSQGYVTFDTPSVVVTSTVGSLPSRQSMSLPLRSGPSLTLPLIVPTNGAPDVQYRHLMEFAQVFQGMTLSVRPSLVPFAPEVPLHPALVF